LNSTCSPWRLDYREEKASSWRHRKELSKLKRHGPVLIGDRFIDKAVIYTLAAEVGNHQMGLQPCAGTGDSCVYTGLMKALLETKRSRHEIGRIASLIIKIGTYFKEGKKTTGCNMEGTEPERPARRRP